MKKAVVLFAVLAAVVLGCSNPSGGGGGRPPPDLWDGTTADSFAGGGGTAIDPYIISTAAQLAYLAQEVNKGGETGEAYAGASFILTRDLNLDFDLDGNMREWTAIGKNTTYRFKGKFDGGGHVIYRLGINKSGDDFQGLFGFLDGAEISNLGLEDIAITGKGYVGGIAGGVFNSSSIENCYSTGTVSGVSQVGGIAGRVDSGSISGSYSTGTVTGIDYTGGIAGYVYDSSSISGSYSTGAVIGTGNYTGGIAGAVQANSSIENCYSTGAVSGTNYIGGIAGAVYSGSISDCYSTGTVNGANRVGGIAGRVESNSSIENCAALNLSVTATSNAGRVAGSISDSNNTFTDNFAWDGMGTGGGGFTPGDDYNGALKAKTVFHSATGFPFDVTSDPWVYTTGRLPVLKGLAGQSNALPTHLE